MYFANTAATDGSAAESFAEAVGLRRGPSIWSKLNRTAEISVCGVTVPRWQVTQFTFVS